MIARARRLAGRSARAARRWLGDPSLARTPEVAERWRAADRDAPPVRVAVIGSGRVAAAHLRVLEAMDDVVLVGLANRGRSDPRPLAERFAIPGDALFDDAEALLDRTRPDLVYVLVSVEAVAPVAARVLERGLPCLIEKPAGLAAADAEDLARLAAERRCRNLVGLNRRFHSVLEHALEAIREHGELIGIHIESHEPIARLRRTRGHSETVVERWLMANSIHAIDLFRRCAGEVSSVESLRRFGDGPAADGFAACLRMASGALGTFAGHWRSPTGTRLVLYGEGVRAELEPLERGVLCFADGRRELLPIDVVDRLFKPGFYAQSAALLRALEADEPPMPPASDLADQVATMRLVEEIGDHFRGPRP